MLARGVREAGGRGEGVRFLSVCSGIEAASVAWHPLGWKAAAFSEIEPFPCAVLAHHYPDVPNLGDMNGYKEWDIGSIDLLVGGTPCQSFSVAGLRKGFDDPRGNLMLVYLAIARQFAPRWVVWENVPGVLSSHGGRDFGTFLGGLAEFGYGFAYRVLDAQFFGVPQRRRRVFVVGHLGNWRHPAAVLFERESLRGYPPPSREAGERVAPVLASGAVGSNGAGIGREGDPSFTLDSTASMAVAGTLESKYGSAAGHSLRNDLLLAHPIRCHMVKGGDPTMDNYIAHALRADGFYASEDGTGRGTPLTVGTLSANGDGHTG